jgi:hypothetical protein
MITRVEAVTSEGQVLVAHDCELLGCLISWDGYNRRTRRRARVKGSLRRALTEIPEEYEQVDKHTVRLKEPLPPAHER